MKPLKAKLLEMLDEVIMAEKAYVAGYRQAVQHLLDEYTDTPVREFHKVFGHPIADNPIVPPLERRILRVNLILEEAIEFANASGVQITAIGGDRLGVVLTDGETAFVLEEGFADFPDIVKAADALGDLRVVTDGSNLEWGFPIEEVLYEINDSNMSKLGEDGKPIYREDGKILKGPNFKLPNIEKVLKDYRGED